MPAHTVGPQVLLPSEEEEVELRVNGPISTDLHAPAPTTWPVGRESETERLRRPNPVNPVDGGTPRGRFKENSAPYETVALLILRAIKHLDLLLFLLFLFPIYSCSILALG
uniref:Transmembrane protein 79 n=1 Tax=Steinernema glaseri TaxID=37863 RepID=A0A1I7Z324_9BILA